MRSSLYRNSFNRTGELNMTPAKDIRETKGLLTELEKRIKEVEEMVETVSEAHAKSVLIGFLDADTERHTALIQGSATYGILRRDVLTFVNCAPRVPKAIHMGRCERAWGVARVVE